MEWCKKHILPTIILLITVEAALASLIWFSGDWFLAGSRETFGPLNNYILIWLSIIVASIAALGTTLAFLTSHDSLELTRESLELTRSTIRPFLSFQGDVSREASSNVEVLKFTIVNSGSLPATKVQTNIEFFDSKEQITEDNHSEMYARLIKDSEVVLVFPKGEYYENVRFHLNDKGDFALWEGIKNAKVKFRVRIYYESLDNKYKTIQASHMAKLMGRKKLQLLPVPPQIFI